MFQARDTNRHFAFIHAIKYAFIHLYTLIHFLHSSINHSLKGKKKTKAKSSKILPLQWKHRANMWLESVKAGFPHEVEELYERFLLRETTRRSRRSSRRTTTTSSTRSRRPSWIRGPLQSTKPCRYSKSKQHTKRRSSEAASGH